MKIFVAGGAGFIGSHFVHYFLTTDDDIKVTVFDNFTSGQMWHLGDHLQDPRLSVIEGDLQDLPHLTKSLADHDCVYHFASNPDIAKAMTNPDLDFWQGTYLTQNILEAVRINSIPKLIYASGSGVYGDTGITPVHEDYSPMLPISPYGSSKLACEVMINAYCHMFDLQAYAFRFANVVGPRQTHGVAYDFIRKLKRDQSTLEILGDGTQSKSYIHVGDVISAIQHVISVPSNHFNYYNVATEDYLDVRQIAQLVIEQMNLNSVQLKFTGGSRGWKGDVPLVRFNLDKIHNLGWKSSRTSVQAMQDAISSMLTES